MARRQLWADRAPAADADRRGEQRRLLVELELDDAVIVPGGRGASRADHRGGFFPAGGAYQYDQRAVSPGGGHRRPRADRADAGRRPYSPQGVLSPERQQASRLSSPYKLKQTVLSSRRGSADTGEDYHDDQSRRAERRTSSRAGGAHTSERSRQRRPLGAGKDVRASPATLVRDAIRQNMFLRDQVLDQLRSEFLPPTIAVPRARMSELNVSSSLVRELNRLRTLSLAVVEMVVYLYSERTADEKKAGRMEWISDISKDEEDAEALEREFFPYLLRMAAADTDFLAFCPGLQRFFDAQSVSLSRNPFFEGLSLDASELLLCSCNYLSASSPSALFSSSKVLTASSSSSSLFQLLVHKLEAFSFQAERYLSGWQVLPCDRVATALLHLMELETRSNAARLLPTYLRPSLTRENSMAAGHRSSSSINMLDSPSMYRAAEHTELSRSTSSVDVRHLEPVVSCTPPRTPTTSTCRAWDGPTLDAEPSLLPVAASVSSYSCEPERESMVARCATTVSCAPSTPQPIPTTVLPSHTGDLASASAEAKRSDDSVANARLFKKTGSGLKVESSRAVAPLTPQPINATLRASEKDDIGSPKAAPQQHSEALNMNEPPCQMSLPPNEATRTPRIISDTSSPSTSILQDSSRTPKHISTIDIKNTNSSRAPSSSRQADAPVAVTGEEHQQPLVPQLPLHLISSSTFDADDGRQRQSYFDNTTVAMSSVPRSASEKIEPITSKSSSHSHNCKCGAEDSSRAQPATTDVTPLGKSSEDYPLIGTPSVSACATATDWHSSTRSGTSISSAKLANGSRSVSTQPDSLRINPSSASDEAPTAVSCFTYERQQAGQEATESDSPSSVASHIARALDLLPRFDYGGTLSSLETEEALDVRFESSSPSDVPTLNSYRSSTINDDDSLDVNWRTELQRLEGATASTSAKTQQPLTTRSEPNRIVRLDSLYGEADRVEKLRSTSQVVDSGALDRIFDLCRDVQVAAFDLSHRFSEIEVDQSYQATPVAPPLVSQIYHRPTKLLEDVDVPRYLERELKVLRRYFASWKDNANHQRAVKQRLQQAAAQRTIQRFGTQCAAIRRQDQAKKQQERQQTAARALQKSWAGHMYRKALGHRSCDFHLVHRCFHRLRFFASTSKRKRRREQAKETILRWWRRCRDRFQRIKKRQEELRKRREQRESATRIVKHTIREWILRRRLAKVQVATRQALFKENLKWTKAKHDHEKTLRIEQRRQIQWSSMMKASMADLESKWKQAEQERVALQQHYENVVKRHHRTIDEKRTEVAAHKIQGFVAACVFKRKLQAAEATQSQTDQRLKILTANTFQTSLEAEKWRQKMRLEQRLLEKKLAKAEKQMNRARDAHQLGMEARLSSERQLQHAIARRTIKAFVDRRCLERRARVISKQQRAEQRQLLAEKLETGAMAAEDLLVHHLDAQLKRSLLEHRIVEVCNEAQQQLERRDQLLKNKDDEVQRVEEQLQQNRLDASRSRLNVWLTQQVRMSRVKKQADVALTAAAQAMEAEKRRQAELVAYQSREVASLKIGAFVTNRVDRLRVQRHEAAAQRQQAEVYAKELVTEQRLRSFVVEMVISVKLHSESETQAGMEKAQRGIREVRDFISRRCVRLLQLRRITKARVIQRQWRQWSIKQKLKREEQARKLQRIDAVRRRENARHIQREWRRHSVRRAKREAERAELANAEALRRRVCAQRMQCAWRQFIVRKQQQQVERARRLKRLEAIKQRECARHIQSAWLQHIAWKRQRFHERELVRRRVECVKRNGCARRIQRAWLASVTWKRQAREARKRKLRAVKRVQRRECAKRIQCAWRQHVQQRRSQLERVRRLKERVRSIRRRESARKIQTAWRAAKRQRYTRQQEQQRQQQEREEAERKQQQEREEAEQKQQQQQQQQRVHVTRQRESARKIAVAWRTAKLRQYQLQQEQEEFERRMRRVEAIQERECARHIQTGWRRHSGQRRIRQEGMDLRILRVDAIKRRECARHIQAGWRYSRERQREALQEEEEAFRQLMDSRLSQIRSGQCARVVQSKWREWHHVQVADRMRRECLSVIQTRRAARSIQTNWREWRRSREEILATQTRLHSIRCSCSARIIQRIWRRWLHAKQALLLVEQQAALLRRQSTARRIQRAWRRWRLAVRQHTEQVSRQAIAEDTSARVIQRGFFQWASRRHRALELQSTTVTLNVSAACIQRAYRLWREKQVSSAAPLTETEAVLQEKIVAMKKRACSRRIARAWRRFRNISEFAAATHIGAVWRGRCARQAYALALASKRSREERLEEIRLSILAVRVQHCYQDWRVRMRRRKRAEMLARESEMVAQAKRQAKLQSARRRVSAVNDAQKRFRAFSCVESDRKPNAPDDEHADGEHDGGAATALLQHDMSEQDELVIRKDVGAVVERWMAKELPYILTTGVKAVLVVDTAATIIQRFSRCYRRRSQLWIDIKRSSLPTVASPGFDPAADDEFRFFFKHASAWMEWRQPNEPGASKRRTLRLRFEAQMTRKLLVMLDHQAHSVDEIRHATTEIATDALPIFASDECLRSHEGSADRVMPYHDVGELELPHFCALTRSMGKIRSMHRRQQHSASFKSAGDLPPDSVPATLKTASSRPRCSRVQSLSVFEAVENASVEDAMFLQSLGEDLGAVEPKMLRNALHLLTFSTENYRFRLEMLDFLLQDGKTDVNAMDINGQTPSMLFAAHGHLEFLSRMAKHGADLQLTDKNGHNVLHHACQEDQVEIVVFLHRTGLPVSSLDLHVPDQSGRYPLHIAASKGLAECAKQLLSNEAASSWAESSASHWDHVLQTHRDSQGRTALHLAVLARDTAMVPLLLTHGGDRVIDECDGMRRSAVHFAVDASTSSSVGSPPSNATDALSILTMLVEHGANMNIGDERGDTPLHWAAFAGNVALVRFLAAHGADATAVNSDWETPAQIAAAYGHFACVKAMGTSPHHGHGHGTPGTSAGAFATDVLLNEAANNFAYQQASSQSYHIPSSALDSRTPASTRAAASNESHYWEEIHQEVQLVDESGRFSSEDEGGSDDEHSANDFSL